MARGRMLSTSIATDVRLNALSSEAELLYLKCIPHLDRDGLILGDPSVLWGTIAPRRPEYLSQMAAIIQEWVDAVDPETGLGLVVRYASRNGDVLFFPGFRNHQSLRYDREAPSSLPPPPGWQRTERGLERLPDPPPDPGPSATDERPQTPAGPAAEPDPTCSRPTLELLQTDAGVSRAEVKEKFKLTRAAEAAGEDLFADVEPPSPIPKRSPAEARAAVAAAIQRYGARVTPECRAWDEVTDSRVAELLAQFCTLFERTPPVGRQMRRTWIAGMQACLTEIGYEALPDLMARLAHLRRQGRDGYTFAITDPYSIQKTLMRLRDERTADVRPRTAPNVDDEVELAGSIFDDTVTPEEWAARGAAFRQRREQFMRRRPA